MRRAALGGADTLETMLAGRIHDGINAGEGDESPPPAGKATAIANLHHKLCAGNLAYTVHGAHHLVFRQRGRQADKLCLEGGKGRCGGDEMSSGGGEQCLSERILRRGHHRFLAGGINFSGLGCAVVVAFPLAPLMVTLI